MAESSAIRDFVGQQVLAVVGASRSGRKFGNAVCRELRANGYRVLPVHRQADQIDGLPCYRSFGALPEPAGGVVVVVPPLEAEQVVRQAAAAGITRVWLQQGAESPGAIRFCEEAGLTLISGQCILMFAEPVRSFHKFHRWLWRVLGKLPS